MNVYVVVWAIYEDWIVETVCASRLAAAKYIMGEVRDQITAYPATREVRKYRDRLPEETWQEWEAYCKHPYEKVPYTRREKRAHAWRAYSIVEVEAAGLVRAK